MGLLRRAKDRIGKTVSVAGIATKQGMRDAVRIELPGLAVEVERCSSDTYPYELTVVLPRVEVRRTRRQAGEEITEEYIYSSLTVAHSPRHPLAGESNAALPMDSRSAVVYTLKQWPTVDSDCRPARYPRSREVDRSALDRRDSADR